MELASSKCFLKPKDKKAKKLAEERERQAEEKGQRERELAQAFKASSGRSAKHMQLQHEHLNEITEQKSN